MVELFCIKNHPVTQKTYMPPAGFEPAIPARERSQAVSLNRFAYKQFLRIIYVYYENIFRTYHSIWHANGATKSAEK
jgi:hypothetical protein